MSLDVVEHMGDLPMDKMRLGREIGPRNYELKKLQYLENIIKLARLEKRSKRKEDMLRVSIENVARDMDHLNSSRMGIMSSGGNGEILSRLVGYEILEDFPTVKEGNFDDEIKFSYKLIGDRRDSSQEIELHTEFTRLRDDSEGSGMPVTTVADFKYSLKKLESRKKQLNEEIKKLWEPYSKVIDDDEK